MPPYEWEPEDPDEEEERRSHLLYQQECLESEREDMINHGGEWDEDDSDHFDWVGDQLDEVNEELDQLDD